MQVFSLPVDPEWARRTSSACQAQRQKAVSRWGDGCRDFFTCAVDPGLEGGDVQGITAVHRQYIRQMADYVRDHLRPG